MPSVSYTHLVTVGGGGIAIHGAEVAVAVHQGVAHGEVLGQTDQGVVDGLVAVGVVAAQHVAHAGGEMCIRDRERISRWSSTVSPLNQLTPS